MDPHTLEKLEFDRIRRRLAEHAQCGLGRELALRILPTKHAGQVKRWLEQLEQFQRWVAAHGAPPFGGIRDVRSYVQRAVPPAKLEPAEFGELASTLMGIDAVRRYFAELGAATANLAPLAGRIADFRIIAERINRVIDSRGKVRDEATDRLYRLRDEIAGVRRQTREVFDRLLKQSSIVKHLQYGNATFHDDRMVLPLKAEQRGRVPGIVHRSSDSGHTLFVEPAEAVELNNRRINLLQSEQEEINRILWELTHLVHLNQKEILRTLEAIGVVDLLTAKIEFGRKYHMNLPAINENGIVRLNEARNPILMAAYEGGEDGNGEGIAGKKKVVPIAVRLGEDFDVMLITGPNTGGKTATLKTVGLLSIMAQAGLPIPAGPDATLPVFQDIWIDVGDEQSLEQSLSTFSGHLAQILEIMKRARKSTLVLLDELGAGTDPDEGAAIGRTIIEHLLSVGCLAIITTHLGALKAIGYEKKRVDNAAVVFDVKSLKPTFELRIGEPGNSNAIAIASRLGMPRRMVDTARRHVSGRQRALHKAIAGTLSARRAAERARRDAGLARQDAARATLAALDKRKQLEAKFRAYCDWVDHVMKLQQGDVVRVRNFDDAGRIVRIRPDKQRASVCIGSKELEVRLADLIFETTPAPAAAAAGGAHSAHETAGRDAGRNAKS